MKSFSYAITAGLLSMLLIGCAQEAAKPAASVPHLSTMPGDARDPLLMSTSDGLLTCTFPPTLWKRHIAKGRQGDACHLEAIGDLGDLYRAEALAIPAEYQAFFEGEKAAAGVSRFAHEIVLGDFRAANPRLEVVLDRAETFQGHPAQVVVAKMPGGSAVELQNQSGKRRPDALRAAMIYTSGHYVVIAEYATPCVGDPTPEQVVEACKAFSQTVHVNPLAGASPSATQKSAK